MQARIAVEFLDIATRISRQLPIIVRPSSVKASSINAVRAFVSVMQCPCCPPCCSEVVYSDAGISDKHFVNLQDEMRGHLIVFHSLEQIKDVLLVKLMES